MNHFDRSKWERARGKGQVLYAAKWIMYLVLYYVFVQIGLFLTVGKRAEFMDELAMLVIAVVVGTVISIIRWYIFEKRYKE
ncbi:hypothetical protein [Paenibacillus sinopodophylli]|uniref:hypothetical protein n=1 Tax=Paenibacillus sinopodophylli TaxID=1837342 RepID=UPI00110D1175|nr:hypothetical protein [Paenibacillus sinopodophylli]